MVHVKMVVDAWIDLLCWALGTSCHSVHILEEKNNIAQELEEKFQPLATTYTRHGHY